MSSSPKMSDVQEDSKTIHISKEVLLQSFDKWHTSFQGLLKERDELKEDVQVINQENIRLTEVHQKTRNEIDVLHSMMKDSNSHLEKICLLEEEIRQLKIRSDDKEKKIETLKTQICEEKRGHSEELENFKMDLKTKLVNATEKLKTEATIERELLQKQVNDREQDLREAEDNLQQLQKTKDAELSRMSLEYENKLARLQRLKTLSNQNQQSSVNSDIFRKKLQNMKVEYESEVSCLKFTIASLEEKLAHASSQHPLRPRQNLFTEKRKRIV